MESISDIYLNMAYVLLFASTFGCIVYSMIHWNRETEKSPNPAQNRD